MTATVSHALLRRLRSKRRNEGCPEDQHIADILTVSRGFLATGILVLGVFLIVLLAMFKPW